MLRERFRFYFVFQVSGHLYNTGQFLVFRADREAKVRVNITGGPLAYHYQFEEIYIHYGMDNDHGSEHRINNYAFPAEVSETDTLIPLFLPLSWKKNDYSLYFGETLHFLGNFIISFNLFFFRLLNNEATVVLSIFLNLKNLFSNFTCRLKRMDRNDDSRNDWDCLKRWNFKWT